MKRMAEVFGLSMSSSVPNKVATSMRQEEGSHRSRYEVVGLYPIISCLFNLKNSVECFNTVRSGEVDSNRKQKRRRYQVAWQRRLFYIF
mmetsp:Transcript_31399/g.61428  ORF Transcript_31399/g.61428 Transcript_31399/m.61428 type:complete len:89 (-) Transcript_31399:58-324(-)